MFCYLKIKPMVCGVLYFVILTLPVSAIADGELGEKLTLRAGLNTRLSLNNTLQKVKENDFSLSRFRIDGQAHRAVAESRNYLPDPTLFASVQNIPTDTFDFGQEAMTQFRFGVRQMFPKGDSLEIQKDLSLINAGIQQINQKISWKKLKLNTEITWLEAWYWQKNIQLIEEDRVFLEQIRDFVQSLYQVGTKDQSDLIGAELELMKLDEKHIEANRLFNQFRRHLDTLANENLVGTKLSMVLAKVDQVGIDLSNNNFVIKRLLQHPEILELDERVDLFEKKVNLAEQAFEPVWGLELSYGLREGENMDGSDRSDLLTAGVNVQLPLFTKGKQNNELSAAKYKKESIQNKRIELLKKMRFQLENIHQQYLSTVKQIQLYENQILPTLLKQKESALNSYESDKGDFRTVTELFIKELNTKIKHQRLRVNEQLMIAKMNYWIGLSDESLNISQTKSNKMMGALGQ